LLYQAQESADVFGGPIREQADDDKENGLVGERIAVEGATDAGDATDDKEKSGTGEGEGSAGAPGASGSKDGGDDAGGAVEGDMQLAWENLETARAIWARDAGANTDALASVHMLLGDVNMENEAFEDALADYDAALENLAAAGLDTDDRRVAEIQFKRCCAAQFLDRIEDALAAVNAAVKSLQRRKAALAASGEEKASEIADVDAVLEELKEKVEELESVAEEAAATKSAMRGAMAQLHAAMAAKAANEANGASVSGVGALTNAANSEPARPGGASPIKDLGVVGRGTKRINLAPVSTATGAGATAAAPTGEAEPKKKRSLEDLMGPSDAGGDTSIGFGAAPDAPAAAEAPVPAFLQNYAKKE
jgi:HAT1-interacting factor 1